MVGLCELCRSTIFATARPVIGLEMISKFSGYIGNGRNRRCRRSRRLSPPDRVRFSAHCFRDPKLAHCGGRELQFDQPFRFQARAEPPRGLVFLLAAAVGLSVNAGMTTLCAQYFGAVPGSREVHRHWNGFPFQFSPQRACRFR